MRSGCKLKTTTITEFVHEKLNSICEQTTDIRNLSDTKIAYVMLNKPALLTSLVVKVFIPVVFVIGFVGNVAFFPANSKSQDDEDNYHNILNSSD